MAKRKQAFIIAASFLSMLLFASCGSETASAYSSGTINPPAYEGPPRTFTSSFENVTDFDDFYIVAQGSYDSNHTLSPENVYDGSLAHKAWILKARDTDNESGNGYLPHRAYPTVQFQNTPEGIYRTPCLVTLYVYLDMDLQPRAGTDDWFSFLTLSPDSSDNWTRTVLVNIAPDGYAHLAHVPRQGEQTPIYQADNNASLLFPYREWVRLDVYIDFDRAKGYAKVWQNGVLVSHAGVKGGKGGLAQVHAGLYAAAAVASGSVYNDRLRIKEVAGEAEASMLVSSGN